MKKKLFKLTFALLMSVLFLVFNLNESVANETIVIGATPVPHMELLKVVKDDLKKDGINLKIVKFNDYVQPNKLLGTKELDANFFQHIPYMNTFAKENKLNLVSLGNVHVEPMNVFSKKIKSLDELKNGSTILIPNDPTNRARALILLESAKVIKLKDKSNLLSTVKDIKENKKNIKIVELSAEQIAPRLTEAEAIVLNANYALDAKISFEKYSIFTEGKDSPYANIVTVLKGRENEEKFKKLMKHLQSEKVKNYINNTYKGKVVPAF